jgi:hypothetical protein
MQRRRGRPWLELQHGHDTGVIGAVRRDQTGPLDGADYYRPAHEDQVDALERDRRRGERRRREMVLQEQRQLCSAPPISCATLWPGMLR